MINRFFIVSPVVSLFTCVQVEQGRTPAIAPILLRPQGRFSARPWPVGRPAFRLPRLTSLYWHPPRCASICEALPPAGRLERRGRSRALPPPAARGGEGETCAAGSPPSRSLIFALFAAWFAAWRLCPYMDASYLSPPAVMRPPQGCQPLRGRKQALLCAPPRFRPKRPC